MDSSTSHPQISLFSSPNSSTPFPSSPAPQDPTMATGSSKGPKRKRLAKACDACHKSKRRCDGTSPCSNCYYASKTCSYTDSSGRPVPAPLPAGPSNAASSSPSNDGDRRKRARSSYDTPQAQERHIFHELDPGMTRELTSLFFAHAHPALTFIHKPTFTTLLYQNRLPAPLLNSVCALAAAYSKQPCFHTIDMDPHSDASPPRSGDLRRIQAGKRFADAAKALLFDRESTPSSDSDQPELAMAELRLRADVPVDVHTAQALALLMLYEYVSPTISLFSLRNILLTTLNTLKLHTPDHPLLTPVPSPAYVQESIERECLRRIFWVLYVMDCVMGVFRRGLGVKPNDEHWGTSQPNEMSSPPLQSPIPPGFPFAYSEPRTIHQFRGTAPFPTSPTHNSETQGNTPYALSSFPTISGFSSFTVPELRLRLPADETSFELGVVHEGLPEYLYLPAIRTQYASELGHLIRATSVWMRVEVACDALFSTATGRTDSEEESLEVTPAEEEAKKTLDDCERLLEEWLQSLPVHLRFTDDSISVQQSMFETSSNTGAWCYAGMHVHRVCSVLSLAAARQHLESRQRQRQWAKERRHFPDDGLSKDETMAPPLGPSIDVSWAPSVLTSIIGILGDRAKNSMILGTFLYPLIKYCGRGGDGDSQVKAWISQFFEFSGLDMLQIARNLWGPAGDRAISALGLGSARGPSPGTPIYPGSKFEPPVFHMPAQRAAPSLNGSSLSPSSMNHSTSKSPSPGALSVPGEYHSNVLPSLKASGLLDYNQGSDQPPRGGVWHPSPGGYNAGSASMDFSGGMNGSSGANKRSHPVGLSWLVNEAGGR